MKMKKAASNVVPMQHAKNEVEKQAISKRDIIRMRFLEQSAIYLGVYIENGLTGRLEDRSVK